MVPKTEARGLCFEPNQLMWLEFTELTGKKQKRHEIDAIVGGRKARPVPLLALLGETGNSKRCMIPRGALSPTGLSASKKPFIGERPKKFLRTTAER